MAMCGPIRASHIEQAYKCEPVLTVTTSSTFLERRLRQSSSSTSSDKQQSFNSAEKVMIEDDLQSSKTCKRALPGSQIHVLPQALGSTPELILGTKVEPWLTKVLKRVNTIKRPLNSVPQHHRNLVEVLSSKHAVWTLASLMLPEARKHTLCSTGGTQYRTIAIKAYIIRLDLCHRLEVIFALTDKTMQTLVEYHKDFYCINATKNTRNISNEAAKVQAMHEAFCLSVKKFNFCTHSHALEGLKRGCEGELPGGPSEEAKNAVMNLFLPLLPLAPQLAGGFIEPSATNAERILLSRAISPALKPMNDSHPTEFISLSGTRRTNATSKVLQETSSAAAKDQTGHNNQNERITIDGADQQRENKLAGLEVACPASQRSSVADSSAMYGCKHPFQDHTANSIGPTALGGQSFAEQAIENDLKLDAEERNPSMNGFDFSATPTIPIRLLENSELRMLSERIERLCRRLPQQDSDLHPRESRMLDFSLQQHNLCASSGQEQESTADSMSCSYEGNAYSDLRSSHCIESPQLVQSLDHGISNKVSPGLQRSSGEPSITPSVAQSTKSKSCGGGQYNVGESRGMLNQPSSSGSSTRKRNSEDDRSDRLSRKDDNYGNDSSFHNTKRRRTEAPGRFPCIYNLGEPARFRSHTKKYVHISELLRHLRSHDFYACSRCFTRFDDDRSQHEHACVPSCRRSRCRRFRPIDKEEVTCQCIETPEEQWRELFHLEYPEQEVPCHWLAASLDPEPQAANTTANSMMELFSELPTTTAPMSSLNYHQNTAQNINLREDDLLNNLPLPIFPGTKTTTLPPIPPEPETNPPLVTTLQARLSLLEQRLSLPNKTTEDLEMVLDFVWQDFIRQAQPADRIWRLMRQYAPRILRSSPLLGPQREVGCGGLGDLLGDGDLPGVEGWEEMLLDGNPVVYGGSSGVVETDSGLGMMV